MPKNRRDGHIAAWEYERAENFIFRAVQRAVFPEEFETLENGKQIRADSPIASLAPVFCHRTRLIRVTTRLSNHAQFQRGNGLDSRSSSQNVLTRRR